MVISGDTGKDTNGNLQLLADDADFLVHEVIDREWVDFKFCNPEPGTPIYALKKHMLEAHTPIDAVGSVAEQCKAGNLVFNISFLVIRLLNVCIMPVIIFPEG